MTPFHMFRRRAVRALLVVLVLAGYGSLSGCWWDHGHHDDRGHDDHWHDDRR